MAKKNKRGKGSKSNDKDDNNSNTDSSDTKIILIGANGEGSIKNSQNYESQNKGSKSPKKDKTHNYTLTTSTLAKIRAFVDSYKQGGPAKELKWVNYVKNEANEVFSNEYINDRAKAFKLLHIFK
mgnify:CR=1 FL=1